MHQPASSTTLTPALLSTVVKHWLLLWETVAALPGEAIKTKNSDAIAPKPKAPETNDLGREKNCEECRWELARFRAIRPDLILGNFQAVFFEGDLMGFWGRNVSSENWVRKSPKRAKSTLVASPRSI
jgi:hypothetical protein